MLGIEQEEMFESMMVLFAIATRLEAKMELTQVRLGQEGYSVELRVTKLTPQPIDTELDGFFSGLNFLDKTRLYQANEEIKAESVQDQETVSCTPSDSVITRPTAV